MAEPADKDYLWRESGLLLHPTSLPGPHGIGDLGAEARAFVHFLEGAGQRLWQILPLGPTGYGNSPYAARSAMAGNPLLIALDPLVEEGLLSQFDLEHAPLFPPERVDYGAAAAFKMPLLRRAYRAFPVRADREQRLAFEAFCADNAFWLEDYALFMALKETHDDAPWPAWEEKLVRRHPEALDRCRRDLADAIAFRRFTQFLFHDQWQAVKSYAHDREVRIVGDIPIFVAMDSADVWAHPELFYLDERGHPTVVAGVPPDYFSKTGQRWGNPLYRWESMAEDDYRWWVERFVAVLRQVDLVRIDHFRGFQAYWEVPAEYETAERGRWVEGPGLAVFRAVEAALGPLPVIAEDLGLITPDVEALRRDLGYPGMKVLHFAFDSGPQNPFLPHNYDPRHIVYTGTHDNDTSLGWFRSRPETEREYALRYMASDGREFHWDLIRLAQASVAEGAVVPVQDVLGLDSWARMNLPGRPTGNWEWRLTPGQLQPEHGERLEGLAETYGRL